MNKRLIFLAGLFSAMIIGSNFMAVKLVDIVGITLPAAIILYPFCYAVGDLINEYYGFKTTRTVIIFTFIFNAVVVGFLSLAVILPPSAIFENNEAFKVIFLSAPRILIASFTAFIISGLLDSHIFDKIKQKNNHLAVRAALSTLLGIVCDSIIFISLSYAFVMPINVLMLTIIYQIAAKILLGIGLGTPLTVLSARLINKYSSADDTKKKILQANTNQIEHPSHKF